MSKCNKKIPVSMSTVDHWQETQQAIAVWEENSCVVELCSQEIKKYFIVWWVISPALALEKI